MCLCLKGLELGLLLVEFKDTPSAKRVASFVQRVFLLDLQTYLQGDIVIDVYFHPQQRSAQRLSLRIILQRFRPSSSQCFMKKEIQGTEVWHLKALNGAENNSIKVPLYSGSSDFFLNDWVGILFQSNESNVRRITLVAGTRVTNLT
jgi:hypothetical protein